MHDRTSGSGDEEAPGDAIQNDTKKKTKKEEEEEKKKKGEENKENAKKKEEEPEDPILAEKRIQLLKAQIIINEAKNESYLVRQLQTEDNFDATQGRCCFTWGNRRGVKLIQFCDALFPVYVPRFLLAILSIKNEKMFKAYADVRRATFFLNILALLGGVFAFIIVDILKYGGSHYLFILLALISVLIYLGVDYHWTNCVVFFLKHPPKRKEAIEWLEDDSEPQYAFQRDPDCEEMKGVVLPKTLSEKIKEMEKKLDDEFQAEVRAMEA